MNITVIGCGRWGSFLAWYLSGLGHRVLMYGRRGSRTFEALKSERRNEYLALSDEVAFTDSLSEALMASETLIISVGAQGLPELLTEIKETLSGNGGKEYILCMKGIVENGGKRLSEVACEILGEDTKYAVWLGPGHAEDFVRGIPNCMLFASKDVSLAKELCKRFASSLIRFYYSADIVGCEIGAASKNVIGIAAGMLDGLNYSSLKGALMARGPREIARLTTAMGGDERSIFGLCHLGDYEATLFSAHSHNRKFGETFVKNESYDKLAEGVYTVRALMYLSEKYGVEMPICSAINAILYEKKKPKEVLSTLFLREQKSEF